LAELDDFTFYRGRVAQSAILSALGVTRGDDIAIQAFTCSAVSEGILSIGARPVYIDIGPGCYTMDPEDLAAKLTPRTRAIIVQHTFGVPADLPRLGAVAAARRLPIVEDCAHAIGSTIGGIPVGTFGVAAFYSFEASKPVFAGIGGSARVNDAALAVRIRRLYHEYAQPSVIKQAQILAMYLAARIAYRPSTFWTVRALYRQAIRLGLIPSAYHTVQVEDSPPIEEFRLALGRVQRWLVRREIAALPRRTPHRRRVAAAYHDRITGRGVRHPELPPGADPVYGRYPLLTPRKAELLRRASEYRVELSDWYATPVHPLAGPALEAAGYRPGSCPNAEQRTAEVVSLPTGRQVNEAQIARAVRLFNEQ
jgi:perosamine synthetase